ncbi:lymphocyte antigen 6E isoform X2 [Mustela erminea]|uniref:lymphocyte antigen 6E isoform X2 n=1 Tax=Mustela erminea TaxID=36723 RepID=UPI0013872E67|nr:lymphocyte antigen 6E isoform X2 [Mustela erminea]
MPAPRPPAGTRTPLLLLLPSARERQLCAARPFAPSSPCAPSPLEPRLRPCSPRPPEPRLRPCFPRPRERRLRPLSPARRRCHESGAVVRLGARLGELGEAVDLRLPRPVPRLSPVRPVWLHAWPGTVGTPDVTGGCAFQSFLENSSELPQTQTSHSRRGSWAPFSGAARIWRWPQPCSRASEAPVPDPKAGNGGIADFTGSLSSALNHTEREAPLACATPKLLEAGAQCPAGP